MINYDCLWETMKKKGISQYSLIKDYHVNESQLHRLRKNMVIKTTTLNRLCEILDCEVGDICQYTKDDSAEGQKNTRTLFSIFIEQTKPMWRHISI